MKIFFPIIPLLLTVFLFAEKTEKEVFVDGVAAIVGDHVILKSDVAQLVNMSAVQQRLNPATDMDKLLQLQKEVVQSVVDQKIMLEMAALDSIEVDDKEVDRALDQQIEMFIQQAGNEDKAEEMLGQSLKSFRREFWLEMRDRLVTERYQQTLINNITISRQDVEKFFNTFKDSIPLFPLTVKLRHLLLQIKPGETSILNTKENLNKIRERILNGESFSKLASLYSQDPGSKKNGGSLGFVKRGSLVAEFESIAFSQDVGVVSEIVETQFGFHIIKTDEKRGDKVRVSHILLIPEITEEDDSKTYKFALSLKDSATTLEEFKRLVGVYSADEQTKDIGGDLGWINPQNAPIPEIAQVISLLEVKECSLPVRTDQGYHLFWVTSFKPGGAPDLKVHWTDIELMALNMKKSEWYNSWITDAREKFYIHINEW
ncbi:MAG: peptidylprolyl isomerase [Fidelibacterota bacterium]